MIWDRFDDAHDDVLKDVRQIKSEIQVLQARLKTAGITYQPFIVPDPSGEPGPQGWYQDTVDEESAYSSYRGYLRTLLDDSSAG